MQGILTCAENARDLRASRQRLLLAARNLSMLCVPEGVRPPDLCSLTIATDVAFAGYEL